TSMNDALKNSIWNFIREVLPDSENRTHLLFTAVRAVAVQVLRRPIDEIRNSSRSESRDWLFDHYGKLQWAGVYDLLEYVVQNAPASLWRLRDYGESRSTSERRSRARALGIPLCRRKTHANHKLSRGCRDRTCDRICCGDRSRRRAGASRASAEPLREATRTRLPQCHQEGDQRGRICRKSH